MCLQSKIVFHIAVNPLAAISPVINIKNPIRTFFKFLNSCISEMHRYRFIDSFFDKTLHHIFKGSIFLVVWLLPSLSVEIISLLLRSVIIDFPLEFVFILNVVPPVCIYMIMWFQTEFNMRQGNVFILGFLHHFYCMRFSTISNFVTHETLKVTLKLIPRL